MHNEVKHAVYIAIELIVTASVIAVVAVALYFGNTFKTIRDNEKASKAFMEEQALFYKYMNESGDINGSDVVDIIVTYSRVYDFLVVYKDNGNMRTRAMLTNNNKLDEWSISNVKNLIGEGINSNYAMRQVLTPDGYAIKAIIFEDTSTGAWNDGDLEIMVESDVFLGYESKYSYK